jgi:CrcB protein
MIAGFGACGALARLGIANLIGPREWPWSTLVVNVAGSFALGLLVAWGTTKLSTDVASAVGVGFIGAFTTYSTFAVETSLLADGGRAPAAVGYLGASVVLGIGAAVAGIALGRSLLDA